jgi:hypothetical protein
MGNRNRNPNIRVNICYELNDNRKCLTLNKVEANALKCAVENEGGVVWWYVPVD